MLTSTYRCSGAMLRRIQPRPGTHPYAAATTTTSPATMHCDGSPLDRAIWRYRVNGSVDPLSPAWSNGQNIAFDGPAYTTLRGYNDLTNLDLRQVGATSDQFASLAELDFVQQRAASPSAVAAVSPLEVAVASPSAVAVVSPSVAAAVSPSVVAAVSPSAVAVESPSAAVAASPLVAAAVSPSAVVAVSPSVAVAALPPNWIT